MSDSGIPFDVRQFVFANVTSVEQLEALIFLWTNKPKQFTALDISNHLRTNPVSVASRLASLASANVLECDQADPPKFCFRPADDKLAKIIDDLAEVYKTRRHRLYDLMFSPVAKISSFADAFIIGKRTKGDGESDG